MQHAACARSQTSILQQAGTQLYDRLPILTSRQPCAPSCSHRVESQTISCSTVQPSPATAVFRPGHRRSRKRCIITRAWFGSQTTRQLWDYKGSCVRKLSLEELQLLHRLSFGHRNQRSYLIVLYQPDSKACQDFEAEVERLATGLRHERAFVAAALDTSTAAAADFATKMLAVDSVPAVLLYPEAARGCLKFLGPDMSAEGMLTAINKARRKALPAMKSSSGAADWSLLDSTTPLAITALKAAAATGDTDAVLRTLQQQMAPIQPTPIATQSSSSIWSQGRLLFWGGMLLCSLLFLAWDMKLGDVWEDWNLLRRQEERAKGKRFTKEENLDDFTTILMANVSSEKRKEMLEQQKQLSGVDKLEIQRQLEQQQYGRMVGQSGQQQEQQQGEQEKGQGKDAGVSSFSKQQRQPEYTMKQQPGGGWAV